MGVDRDAGGRERSQRVECRTGDHHGRRSVRPPPRLSRIVLYTIVLKYNIRTYRTNAVCPALSTSRRSCARERQKELEETGWFSPISPLPSPISAHLYFQRRAAVRVMSCVSRVPT